MRLRRLQLLSLRSPSVAVEGLDEVNAMFDRVIANTRRLVLPAIDQGADEFLAAARASCPVSQLETHTGALKEGLMKSQNPFKEGQTLVGNYAYDDKGNYIAAHVELGHRAPDGSHVPAQPSFWPAWRLTRKRIYARIQRQVTRAVREASVE